MFSVKIILKSLGVLGLLSTLSACATSPGHFSGAEIQKRNTVEHVRLSHAITWGDEGQNALSPAEIEKITLFINQSQVGYGDVLSLDLEVTQNSATRREALRDFLLRRGLQLEYGSPISGPLPAPNQGILIVDRYILTAPRCEYQNLSSNLAGANYGCSSQTLLGQMIANPRDLIRAQSFDIRSNEAQINGLKNLRSGLKSSAPLPSPVTGSQTNSSQPQL